MRLLLTGFEPFGGYAENSSWEVAKAVASCGVLGVEVIAEQLPVSFHRVEAMLRTFVERHRPDVIIMLGQSALTDRVKLERVALNMMDSKMGDNDGYKPSEEAIYEGENNALFTTLPIKQLHRVITENNIPAKISNSAGLYVCNRTYYGALRLCKERAARAIFVHLPLFEGQATDKNNAMKMPLEDMIKAIEIIINEVTLI